MNDEQLKELLDTQADLYNQASFIAEDPISVPHRFTRLQDIEIMGFWAAMLAWGQRKTIIGKANELVGLMDGAPFDFVLNHQEHDRKRFLLFKHRTFQPTDTLHFLAFFQWFYQQHCSLEMAFSKNTAGTAPHIGAGLQAFHELFFSLPDSPGRTRKHVASPLAKSSCKRLNMFLRWMVRRDDRGVDFGLWQNIRPAQLLIPLDVHVERVARKLGLLERKQPDWLAVLELTDRLRQFDPTDPVRYDFALFGMGVTERGRI